MSQKLVVVLGATGTQGSSVVRALLKHDSYAIRAVTRDPDSSASKALKEKGVDVVAGNLTDKDSLIKAFEGAYAVFGVTIPFTQDSEELQGRNIVDASLAAKVPLLVWSSLPSAAEASKGKYTKIIHFEQKHEVDKYIATTGQPAVIVLTGGFAENLLKFQQLTPDPADPNKWAFTLPILRPDVPMIGIWIGADLGNIVVAVIDHWEDESWRERLTKEPIVAAPFEFSGKSVAETIAKVSGKEVTYVQREPFMEFERESYSAANDGFFKYPSTQPHLVEELGVKTHSFKDYAREVLVPYIQSKQ